MSFTIFYIKKTPFKTIKIKRSSSRKTDIFPKGLTHSFGSKLAIFPTLFFRKYNPGKCLLRYSRTKKSFLGYKNKKFKKSKNKHFSKGFNPWFWSKNSPFSNFFWGNIGQENVFYDILHQKNAFVAYKKISSKSTKTDFFPNGLTHSFGSKLAIFQTCFF